MGSEKDFHVNSGNNALEVNARSETGRLGGLISALLGHVE